MAVSCQTCPSADQGVEGEARVVGEGLRRRNRGDSTIQYWDTKKFRGSEMVNGKGKRGLERCTQIRQR